MYSASASTVTRPHARQRGVVLLSVVVVMFATLLVATTLVTHYGVAEADAVEQSLAEVRAYWALRGQLDYVLSRARQQGDNLNFLTNLVGGVEGLLGSLETIEYEPGYRFSPVAELPPADLGNNNLRITLSLEEEAEPIPVLRGLHGRLSPLVAEVCIGSNATTDTHVVGAACGTNTSNNGISRITALYWREP